jgi:hypothetical protein
VSFFLIVKFTSPKSRDERCVSNLFKLEVDAKVDDFLALECGSIREAQYGILAGRIWSHC